MIQEVTMATTGKTKFIHQHRLPKITYFILEHRFPQQFKRIFGAVYEPQNYYASTSQ